MALRDHIDAWGPRVLTAAVVLGGSALMGLGWQAARADAAFRVDPNQVAVLSGPAWLDGQAASFMAAELGADLAHEAPLLDGDTLARWSARMLAVSPWVEEVVSVEPRFPGQADVRLRLARPVLRLSDDTLVAWDGRLLGRAPIAVTPEPLAVRGRPDAQGMAECAAAAIELLPFRERLEQEELGVAAVALEGGGRVVFETHEGVTLEWGRSARVGGFSAVDLPPAARIQALLDVALGRPGLIGIERVVLWKERPEIYERP